MNFISVALKVHFISQHHATERTLASGSCVNVVQMHQLEMTEGCGQKRIRYGSKNDGLVITFLTRASIIRCKAF